MKHVADREQQSKDWTGNQNSIYTTLGASNHSDKDREQHDCYATERKAAELIKVLKFIIRSCGFELIERVKIKDTKTGREFR